MSRTASRDSDTTHSLFFDFVDPVFFGFHDVLSPDQQQSDRRMKTFSIFALLVGILSLANCEAADLFLTIEGREGVGNGQHIVFVTGEEYYRSEEGMSMFAKIMARHHGFRCTVLFAIDPASGHINPNRNNNIPGLAALDTADLMVIFARFRELNDADMKHIVDYVNAGKPVLGIRNATHAFRYSPQSTSLYKSWDWQSKEWAGGFGQQILGDTWIAHYGQFQKEATRAHVNMTQRNHPVLRGVADTIFCHTDVNSVERLTANEVVLFHGQVLSGLRPTDPPVTDNRKETRMPFAWFKTYTAPSGKPGRSFTTTAGASLDWLSEDLRRLMVNAMLSLTGHEKEIPDKTNVSFVDDYNPKPTGAIADSVWAAEKLTPASFAIKNSPLRIGHQRVDKVLFLGNSITLHGPAPNIDWTGNWGMAASTREKDFVHLLLDRITKAAGGKPAVMVKNIADFERRQNDFNLSDSLKDELAFEADLIVLAIGENASSPKTDDAKAKYSAAFAKLLAELKKRGHPTLLVRSCFWADPAKDQIMKKACEDAGGVFVDNSKFGGDESNYARSERKIEHAGVAGHPGDKGMQAIADALWSAIQKQAGLNQPK